MSIGTFKNCFTLCFLAIAASTFAQEKKVADSSKAVETDPVKLFEPRQFAAEDGKVLNYRLLKPIDFKPTGIIHWLSSYTAQASRRRR